MLTLTLAPTLSNVPLCRKCSFIFTNVLNCLSRLGLYSARNHFHRDWIGAELPREKYGVAGLDCVANVGAHVGRFDDLVICHLGYQMSIYTETLSLRIANVYSAMAGSRSVIRCRKRTDIVENG
jgi:hypothetical protein